MKKQTLQSLLAVSVLALLTACGGGGAGGAGKSVFGQSSTTSTTTNGTNSVTTSASGAAVVSISSSQISSSSPGLVTVVVKDSAGNPVSGEVVKFSVSETSLATVTPSTVLLNASGVAQATVKPVSTNSTGAAYVVASGTVGTATVSGQVAFTVAPTTVTLNTATADQPTLPAYASTGVSFTLSGASASVPVTVTVSSTCATSGKATITPVSQTLTTGSGSVTYQDKGCATTDRVVLQIDGSTQTKSVDIAVAATTTRGIEFVSASPATICIFGSGCTATSEVTFLVTDENGLAKPSVNVDFTVDQPESAELVSTSGKSDASGLVRVSVKSKARPGPVRVKAVTQGSPSFQTVSSALTVNAGLPRNAGVSFSASKYAMNGNLDGDEADLRLALNDRFGNPVPDGTTVSLVAEGGTVVPASCQTVGSVCNVKFLVSNPRPTDGRVEVVAYAQGEEDFVDANSSSQYDAGESHTDLGPVELDKNEDGIMDVATGERLIGADKNNKWDDNIYVRLSRRLFFSVTAQAPRIFEVVNSGSTLVCSFTRYAQRTVNLGPLGKCEADPIAFCVRDANDKADPLGGNPIASGSTLAMTTKATGATAQVDNSPISSAVQAPTFHVLNISRSDCAEIPTAPGSVTLNVTTGGSKYPFAVANIVLN